MKVNSCQIFAFNYLYQKLSQLRLPPFDNMTEQDLETNLAHCPLECNNVRQYQKVISQCTYEYCYNNWHINQNLFCFCCFSSCNATLSMLVVSLYAQNLISRSVKNYAKLKFIMYLQFIGLEYFYSSLLRQYFYAYLNLN